MIRVVRFGIRNFAMSTRVLVRSTVTGQAFGRDIPIENCKEDIEKFENTILLRVTGCGFRRLDCYDTPVLLFSLHGSQVVSRCCPMHQPAAEINSQTVGDRARFRTYRELAQALPALKTAKDKGAVVMLMARGEGGRREILRQAALEVDAGMPGDAWNRRAGRKPDMSIAVMQSDVAELIANGQPIELAGDNLYLALDLSTTNLPAGSRVRAGSAILEVTPYPHDGCKKFRARFGDDAVRFTSEPALRHLNLRGIYMRVIEAGIVRSGDFVEVIFRPKPAEGASR
jgi:hypothetical protein